MHRFLANLGDALLYHIYWLVKVSSVLFTYWLVEIFFALCVASMLLLGILDTNLAWYSRVGLVVAGAGASVILMALGVGAGR